MEFSTFGTDSVQVTINRENIVIGPLVQKGADVQLLTTRQGGSGSEHGLRVFDGPGEYEVKGIMIDGVTVAENTTAYHLLSDGVALAAVSLPVIDDLTDEVLEKLQPADVLCLWLAQGTPQDLSTVIGRFESKVVLLMGTAFSDADLAKETQSTPETVTKLKITAKELALAEAQRLIRLAP